MTRWATLAIALLFSAIATVHTTDTASGQDGWITLFDGKNLDQWQGDGTATFKIEDGSVIATDKKDPKPSRLILSPSSHSRISKIRAEFWSATTPTAASLSATPIRRISAADRLRGQHLRPAPRSTYGTGAIVPFAKSAVPIKAGGKWNTYEIVAKGPKFTVTLNGVKTVDGAENADHKEGPIALQFGVGTVKYRKVLIKPL